MKLQDQLQEYRKLKVLSTLAPNESEQIALYNQINSNLRDLIAQPVDDVFTATLLFSEMTIRKIGELAPFCAYYYGTKCKMSSFPENQKVIAHRLRLTSFFRAIDIFSRIVMLAQSAPMIGYTRNLTEEQFMDFLIMSDAYEVWDSDKEDAKLMSIQKQVQQRQMFYPSYTKERIISEGRKAHEALFTALIFALGLQLHNLEFI